MLVGVVCAPGFSLETTTSAPKVRRRHALAILEETCGKPARFWREWLCSGDSWGQDGDWGSSPSCFCLTKTSFASFHCVDPFAAKNNFFYLILAQ